MIKPWELHRMTLRDVFLAIDGLREKDLTNQAIIRRATAIIASALGGKKVAGQMDRLWPMPRAKGQKSVQQEAKERIAQEREKDERRKVKHYLEGKK